MNRRARWTGRVLVWQVLHEERGGASASDFFQTTLVIEVDPPADQPYR